MVSTKAWNRIILSLVIMIGVVGGLIWRTSHLTPERTKPILAESTEKSSITRNDTASQSIVFAGLSGVPPQFIEQGPDKGYGWAEYETYEIRKALKEEGFSIKQDWMTPARIAHEFKVGSPICTYPVKWRDPAKTFATKPDRIYSIPIKLEGNESRKVLFRQKDLPKFQKHFDKKGDLNIDSLLQDKALKTLLVRDFDYGALGLKVLNVDAKGDQFVRKDYQDHVILLLVKDNRQILEMLNAHRFDYVLADEIEDQDFKLTGIKKEKFKEVGYQTERIGQNIQDPNIVMVSIACSVHPLTLKLIPSINEKISRLREHHWFGVKSQYRSNLDPTFKYSGTDSLLIFQFQGVFEAGGADYWYPKQQKFFPGLLLSPSPIPQIERDPIAVVSHPLHWRVLSEENGAVTIIHESSPNYRKLIKHPHNTSFYSLNYPDAFNERYLSVPQKKFYFDPSGLFNHPSVVTDFKKLSLDKFIQSKKLTLFANGLSLDELKVVAPLFPALKEVVIFGAGTEETTYLVSLLPKQLERLTMISCSLSLSDIHTRIRGMPLKALHLSDSQVTQRQMGTLISNIPESITELSLGYHRGAFSREVVKALETRSWPHLIYLDLENDVLFDEHLDSLAKAIPSQIEILKLGLNYFHPQALIRFFHRDFPRLKELDLSNSYVGSSLAEGVTFPSHIKKLLLMSCGITSENLRKIRIPQELEVLDLTSNHLGDEGVLEFLSHLGKKVQYLNLGGTKVGNKSLQFLAKPGQFEQITELNLDNNLLKDSDIEILAQGSFEVEKMSLKTNRIHNAGTEMIAQRWLPHLKALNLSETLITEEGIAALARNMNPELLELSLGSVIALDVQALAQSLPKHLQKLDLSGNQISNREIEVIAPHIPASLLDLRLDFSAFTAEGAWHLARFLPQHLTTLMLEGTPIENQGLIHITRALPSSMKDLTLGPALLESSGVDSLSRNLPKSLRMLELIQLAAPKEDLVSLFRVFPKSLTLFSNLNSPISLESLSMLNSHWPHNLRQLYFQGVKLGDQKIIAFSHKLPPSIERLALMGADMGDLGLAEISKNALENFHILEWIGNHFSSQAFNTFMSRKRSLWRIEMIANEQIQDGFLASLRQENLEMIRVLHLDGLGLTEKGLVPIFKKLNSNFSQISIESARITPQGVDGVIHALPSALEYLSIRGIAIGEHAKEKFRQHAKEQEALTGLKLELDE